MECTDLASTGSPLASLLVWGCALLLLGLGLVVAARACRNKAGKLLVLSLLAGGGMVLGLAGSPPASAAPVRPPGCDATQSPEPNRPDNVLTVIQTSTLTGLAPGVAAAPITGVIVNHGDESPVITAVTVTIAAVTKAPGAAAGPCDTTDYLLRDARMPIGRALPPGGSATFSGASIQFNDKPANQDACQGAHVHLWYLSS
jgi:hypothetical protein